MVVGGHLDFLYGLPGPLPAGSYTVVVETGASGGGPPAATLEADLQDVSGLPDGGESVTLINTQTYALPQGMNSAEGNLINATFSAPAVAAQCGDTLRLRVTMTQGPPQSYFADIQPTLSIP